MLQWEIYDCPHPSAENPHPCVILSPTSLADDPAVPFINVLACTSLRPADRVRSSEVRLNGADELSGPTVVRCNLILAFRKAVVGAKRGRVSLERQRAIKRKLGEIYKLGFF